MPMIYVKWTQDDLATLKMPALYTEVDEDGWVQRELLVDDDGTVADRLIPSTKCPGWFGLARLSAVMLESNVTRAEFESLWQSGTGRKRES
jgi:hypothetical protein